MGGTSLIPFNLICIFFYFKKIFYVMTVILHQPAHWFTGISYVCGNYREKEKVVSS